MNGCAAKLIAVKGVFWLLWPTAVYAATVTSALSEIDGRALLTTLLLSLLAGVTGMLARLKLEYDSKVEVHNLWLFVLSNISGAFVAGLIAWFLAEWVKFPASVQAVTIMLAAYGGTWVIERLTKGLFDKYLPPEGPAMYTPVRPEPDNSLRNEQQAGRSGAGTGNEGKYD